MTHGGSDPAVSPPPPSDPARRSRRGSLRIRHLWLGLPFIAVAFRSTFPIGDNSFLWHVRAGQAQLEAGEVLRSDPFSFTFFDAPWRTQSWLLELGYGALENWLPGIPWVSMMIAVLASMMLVFVGLAAYRHVPDPMRVAVILGMVAWIGFFYLVPRPVLASFVLFAVTAVVLQHEGRVGWALVPLVWVWAGVHGSFPVGLGLIGLEAVRRRSWRLVELAALSGVVTLLSAHGFGTWMTLLRFFESREALEFLSEWGRPQFLDPLFVPALLAVGLVVLAVVKRALPVSTLVVVVPFVLFAVMAERSVFPAMVVVAPYSVAGLVGRGVRRNETAGSPMMNAALAMTMAIVAALALARPVPLSDNKFPPQAALDALGSGRTFHGPAVGGLLIYEQWPDRLVFVDDRAELYGAGLFGQVVDGWEADGHEKVFAEHGFTQAIVKRTQPLAAALEREGWERAYADDVWVVLRRPQ